MSWTIKAIKEEHLSTNVVEGGERASVVEWYLEASDNYETYRKLLHPAFLEDGTSPEIIAESLQNRFESNPWMANFEIKLSDWKKVA
jgi:hypothetical protein